MFKKSVDFQNWVFQNFSIFEFNVLLVFQVVAFRLVINAAFLSNVKVDIVNSRKNIRGEDFSNMFEKSWISLCFNDQWVLQINEKQKNFNLFSVETIYYWITQSSYKDPLWLHNVLFEYFFSMLSDVKQE